MGQVVKTGGWGLPWVVLERPKPPRVEDPYATWPYPLADLSPRCSYWLRQIDRGWRPNRHLRRMGYYEAAEWYGVYISEYLDVISARLQVASASSARCRTTCRPAASGCCSPA